LSTVELIQGKLALDHLSVSSKGRWWCHSFYDNYEFCIYLFLRL